MNDFIIQGTLYNCIWALEPERIFKLSEKWFGNIEPGMSPVNSLKREQDQTTKRYQVIRSDVPVPLFIGACHMPERNHPDYYACDLLSDILANGKSSRFYHRLVRELKVMNSVDCYLSGTFDPGLIVLEGRPAQHVSVQESIEHLWKEVDRLKTQPPSLRELQKVKKQGDI